MTESLLISRRDTAQYVAGFAGLTVVTIIAAIVFVPRDISIAQNLWPDVATDGERVASWRGAAVLAYTAGSGTGHVCAMLAGWLAGRWAVFKTTRSSLITGVAIGAGLGVVNLAVAAWKAAPRLDELAKAPHLRRVDDNSVVVNPTLTHHGYVIAAMIVVFVIFLVAAGLGFCVAQVEQLLPKLVLLGAAVVLAPIAQYVMAAALLPIPG